MASLTITVPDSVVPRILSALNCQSAADVQAWIKDRIKEQVALYEGSTSYRTTQQNVLGETW